MPRATPATSSSPRATARSPRCRGTSITVEYANGREEAQGHVPAVQVPPLEPGHVHQPEAAGRHRRRRGRGRHARRRPVDPPGRARARQEPPRRVHAVEGPQLRGRDRDLGAARARRRAHLDPHRGARDRRPRHQARRRGDHPRHPEPLRGHPQGPRRARHHPHRCRGRPRRHPRRQGHARRARPSSRPEERLLRAIFGEKAREVRDTSLKVPHGETGKVIDVRDVLPRRRRRAAARREPARAGVRRAEAQDQRGRQARRPPRQQGRDLQDPARSRTCPTSPTARRSTSCSTRSVCRAA